MLKNQHIVVGAAAPTVIVWRIVRAAPFELLFVSLEHPDRFYTLAGGMVACHSVPVPHGAMEVAAQLAAAEQPVETLAKFRDEGLISDTMELISLPDWADREQLFNATSTLGSLSAAPAREQELNILEI